MRVHLQTLGCRLNEAEVESWSRDFQLRGHRICAEPDQADLLVVNTCAVTEEAVRKSRKLLRRAHRDNPGAKLVITGCYASLQPGTAGNLPGVDLLVPNPDKDRLVEIASRALDLDTMPAQAMEPDGEPLWIRRRHRAFIKVQDGCRYQCTFCIVTLARGEERSRPVAEVVAELNQLRASGIQEAVLTGVQIGGYGRDLGTSLADLVRAILADTDLPRLRIGSLEPWGLPWGFWSLFDNPRLLPHLHLPLQSGSDPVLRRMARRCKASEFLALAERARERVADLNLTTDIIVGFPGETDQDWQATLDLVQQASFGQLHIFPFSPRQGTRAAQLADPVDPVTLRARCQQLQAVGRQLKRAHLEGYLGRRVPVLVEGRGRSSAGNEHWFGYSPSFVPVQIPLEAGGDLENRILDTQLTDLAEAGEALLGRI